MKTVLFLNSTALNYLACDRHYQVSALWGYSDASSAAAEFGTNFHTFAYHLEGHSKSLMDQVQDPELNQNLKADKELLKACVMYESSPVLAGSKPFADKENIPSVEYKFHIPWLEVEDYEIHLVGTIDRLDLFSQAVRVIDRKTSRKATVADVLQGYVMQVQVPFYMYVWKKYLSKHFFDEKYVNLPVMGQYLGVFISLDPPKFELSNPIVYSPSLETDIEGTLMSVVPRMIELHKRGTELAPPTGMAAKISDDNVCKYCFLRNLCATRNHDNIINYLKSLTPKPYDPRNWR